MTSTEHSNENETVTRKITYAGSSARVGQFAQMLQDEGVEVEYEPPVERRGTGSDIAVGVIVYILTKGGDAAINAVVHRFRRQVPQAKITIEDESGETGVE
jgi:hypothetical protein